jgi:hypothetical protein
MWKLLSSNESLPWSIKFIEIFKNNWDWKSLSENKGVPWSIELLETFKDNLNWDKLSRNNSLPWSLDLVDNFLNYWNWNPITLNKSLLWTTKLFEKYPKVNIHDLCLREDVLFDLEFFYKHAEKLAPSNSVLKILSPYISMELIEEVLNKNFFRKFFHKLLET